MQPSFVPSPMDLRFRRGIGLCLLGIAVLLLGLISVLSPQLSAPLLFGFVGFLLVLVGAVSLMAPP